MANRKNLIIVCFLSLPSIGHSQSLIGQISPYFDIEGNKPYLNHSSDKKSLTFSAIASKHITPNGHGWRNEIKKKKALRTDMYQTSESIAANVRFHLSKGAKTIFTQYHESSKSKTPTLLLLYISDMSNKKLINSKTNDGIFDIYAIYTPSGSMKKTTVPFTALPSGSTFSYRLENHFGEIKVTINGVEKQFKTKNADKVYLKIGDYLQAQDPITKKKIKRHNWPDFYKKNIKVDKIEFRDFEYKK